MNNDTGGITLQWPLAIVAVVGLIVLGAVGTVFVVGGRQNSPDTIDRMVMPLAAAQPASLAAASPGALVRLTPELIRRADIEVSRVDAAAMDVRLRLPAEVQPNAYRSVSVTPLVPGRITTVAAELGERVTTGQTMVQVYSPELARAEMVFLASRAELGAHDLQLQRTQRLIEIGASSQQELEHVHAEHTAMSSQVEAARSTLELLGLSPAQIAQLASTAGVSAVVDVPAPIDGVVTERVANLGLNVDPSMSLFTVVDLSMVWVVADLFERDFGGVQIGSPAVVTATAYPDFRFEGRVSYIDPQVQPDTRTAKLRIEIPNADGRLRLGMFVDVDLPTGSGNAVVVIPTEAVQTIGDQDVVYVPGEEPGTFMERAIELGPRSDGLVQVQSGLIAGESVVTSGAFFLRAERERLSPRVSTPEQMEGGMTMPPP